MPPSERAKSKGSTREASIRHWKTFLDWTDDHSNSRWVFRGLGDADFPLIPSAGRVKIFNPVHERAVFELFRKRIPEFGFNPDMGSLDLLALAQHHGIPTRLLDWTTNPLVATFFAAKAGTNPNSDARIVAVRVQSGATLKGTDDPFAISEVSFYWPGAIASRITSQSGLFTVHQRPAAAWIEPLSAQENLFDIPGSMRAFFQQRLYYLGVHDHMIMGGLDGVGARLRWQYKARAGLGAI